METGCEESESAVGIQTGSSFGRHFGEKPKIYVFLSPVFPLPLAMQGRYWGPLFSFLGIIIRAKFRGRRPRASYFSYGSLVKKPS